MAKYEKYTEYKDSGIEWLGEIPSDWIVSKFGYVKTVLTDYTANGSFADLKSNVIYLDEPSFARLVRLTDLRKNLDNDNGVWIDKKSYEYLKKSALFGGEFLLANVGAYAGLFYQMPMDKGYASLAPNMFMAKFEISKVLPRFMAYVGQADNIAKQLQLSATASSAQPKLNKDDFKKVTFAYPSLVIQTQIANFLDHETAQIDTLIAKQEKLIELLKEKRQAVISHAVTKGLNPDVTMKDSGVEWLGQVPASWLVTPLKYLIAPKRGAVKAGPFGSHLKNSDMEGQDIKVISQKNVIANDLNLGEAMISEKKYRELEVFTIEQDDVLVTTRGTIGRTCVFKENFKAILHPCLIRLQVDHNKVLPELIALIIQESGYEMEQILIKSNATTIEVIYSDNLINTVVVIPNSLEEQKQVLSYIDNQKAYFDKALKKANQMIQKLIERRTALISSAVTGKIDVRNWQNPNYNNNEANTELGA